MLVESQNRVQSMALVHERLYQSPNIARIAFGEYIRQLVYQLLSAYQPDLGSVKLEVDVRDDVTLAIDEAVPCGLILNELVSNAFKHAFPDGRPGVVRVELRREDGVRAVLIVSDDGVGVPEGLDLGNTTSLGMQLIHTLVYQLDGRLALERNGGTAFRIEFAIPGGGKNRDLTRATS
jgi:two-component sensor histidine kinase